MKTIGLIGGTSWESTLEYYRIINELVRDRLGGFHSAKILLYSVDFDEFVKLMNDGRWNEIADRLIEIATKLERCGAELLLICTNTMHRVADEVQKVISIPLVNIIDVTAEKIKEKGLKRVGLLGTKFTMEDEFYKNRLKAHGIDVVIPEDDERNFVHNVIMKELCFGIVKESSKDKFREIIEKLISKGAEGIVLGCTEIPLLIKQEDCNVPLFDTTRIHAEAAVELALNYDPQK